MASSVLLRCWNRNGQLLFKSQITNTNLQKLLKPDAVARTFSLTPSSASLPVPDYLRARRGPFTPMEKQGQPKMFASTHWKIERILAVSMLGIMPAALFVQGPIMDFVLSTSVFLHGFWGLDHVLTDYLQKFIPFIHYVWYVIAAFGFACLMHFNYNDVGVSKAIQMVWKIK